LVASPSTVTIRPVIWLTAAGPQATPQPMRSGPPSGSRTDSPAAMPGTVSAASTAKATAAPAAVAMAACSMASRAVADIPLASIAVATMAADSQVAKNASPT